MIFQWLGAQGSGFRGWMMWVPGKFMGKGGI